MFNRILVGTDGSDSAALAIDHAVHLAEALGAQVTVAAAHDPDDGSSRTGGVGGVVSREVARALLGDALSSHHGRVRIEGRVVPGSPGPALARLASSGDFDLVVVGNRGRAGGNGRSRHGGGA